MRPEPSSAMHEDYFFSFGVFWREKKKEKGREEGKSKSVASLYAAPILVLFGTSTLASPLLQNYA